MSENVSSGELPQTPGDTDADDDVSPKLLGTVAIAVMFFWDLMFSFSGGGAISVYHAVRAVQVRALSIDIDSNGLNLAFVIVAIAVFIGTCRTLKISTIVKRKQWIFYVTAILIVLTFDIGFEGGIIEKYMNAHGYDRCVSQDRHVGHGKGSIWFSNYVLAGVSCKS